jgi:hypothetical protein
MFDDLGGAVSYLIAVLMTPHEPTGFPNTTGQRCIILYDS